MSYYSCFFFFKQKTAYEMRISDWSSDVCSSDLDHRRAAVIAESDSARRAAAAVDHHHPVRGPHGHGVSARRIRTSMDLGDQHAVHLGVSGSVAESEEHTSELQSLMRNSYAVFCLKKKKTRQHKSVMTNV